MPTNPTVGARGRSRLAGVALAAALLAARGRAAADELDPRDADPPPPSLHLTHYTLGNGLDVILAPDPSVTSVIVNVWYHVGSKDEAVGKTGFAHLFEHLMFEGSKHVGNGDFDQLLESAGGWNNATTSNDRTDYFEQVPANFLGLALYLEADRMVGLWDAMDQRALDNQRDVVKNERRESYENTPYGVAELALQEALWPEGHGNHHPTIGSMADLTSASLADVEAFWRTYYRASNATLVIAGGFDLAAGRALVDTYFGWMPAKPRPTTRTLEAPVAPRTGATTLAATDRVSVPKVMIAWRTAAPYTAAATDLELAARLLGGGRTSRLYRRLVKRDRLATEVYASYEPQILGGQLQIDAIARDGVDPAALRAAIDDEVARFRATPPSADELARAITMSKAELLASLENLASRAELIAQWAALAGEPDQLAAELARLQAVTPASLAQTAVTWLAADAAVTMIVTPAPSTAPATSGGAP